MAARTRRAAHAVQVRLEVGRHVHVDHRFNARNVQATCGYVGRQQKVRLALAEAVQRLQALVVG